MSDAEVDGYASAILAIAQAEDALDRVSDELFRFSRAVDANPELRSALTDPGSSGEAKARVIGELLDNKAAPVTTRLVTLLVDSGHARDFSRIVDAFIAKAGEAGQASLAEVRVASPISEDQRQRLAEVLTQAKGRPVDVKVIVDPSVLGGVVTTIGDEVIDGSVRRRLEQLRAELRAS